MKKLTKFFMAALLAGMFSFGYAQDYFKEPQPDEKVLEIMNSCDISQTDYDAFRQKNRELPENCHDSEHPFRWYNFLLQIAKKKYPNKMVDIRGMKDIYGHNGIGCGNNSICAPITFKIVYKVSPQDQWRESVSPGMDKAFRNVREGSRIAIDQVTVLNGMNREEMKDQIIDILLDKGFKVVAKEYLEKLYEEQQSQQSGIYNDRTTVQENNFSAVGYYVNVKVTETSLRVQVINVSTGEYEGNATINF